MLKKLLLSSLVVFIFFAVTDSHAGPLKTSLTSTTHSVSAWSNVNRITVKWTKPDADSTYGEVRGYAILWDTNPDTNPGTYISLDGNATEVTSPPLADGTIYFHIRVIYEDGSPLEWDNLGPFWIDTSPPSKPSNLAVAAGDGRLTLSWTNPGESDLQGVMIRRSVKTGDACSYPSSPTSGDFVATLGAEQCPKGSTCTYVDSNLTNGTTYCYSIFSFDQRGDESTRNYSSPAQGQGTPVAQAQLVIYPTISSTDPADKSINVPITTVITISFSKDMNMATIYDAQGASSTIIVKDAQNNTVAGTWSQVTSKTVRFTPKNNLEYSTQYTVTILGGTSGVKDTQGNNFDGNGDGIAGTSDKYTFTFTTAAYAKPTVSSTIPVNNATDIDPLTSITITFSKTMNPTSVNTNIIVKEGSVDKPGYVTYSQETKTATFSLPKNTFFTGGATVTVTVKGGEDGVKDENNVGMDNDYTFSFTIKNTPIIDISSSKLEFGNTTTNTTKDMDLTVTNKGQATLKFGDISITDGANFTIKTNGCTSDLNLNQTCTITVTFAPGTSTDLKTGTLKILSNSGRGDTTTSTETKVSLSGQGVQEETPSISVSVPFLEFPTTVVNQESSAKTFTIRNSGTTGSTLTINSITFQTGTDFKGTVSCEGGQAQDLPLSSATNLAYDETCTVSVVFSPKSSGAKTDILTINSTNAGNKNVALYGQAVTYYTYTLNLASGWNLISLPYEPVDTAIGTVLAGISGKFAIVWAYDPTEGWQKYQPGKPSDLTEMKAGKGYWIKANESLQVQIIGNIPSRTLNLASGWNLVGYNKTVNDQIANVLAGISGKFAIVWAYDPTEGWQKYQPGKPSDLTEMKAGKGYWIKATEATTWSLP